MLTETPVRPSVRVRGLGPIRKSARHGADVGHDRRRRGRRQRGVFHATGKRIRDLPITLDKLM